MESIVDKRNESESSQNDEVSSYFHVVSASSTAGVGTSIVVESGMKTRLAFDIGSTPNFAETFKARFVFVSHGHIDHIGGIFSHARAHALLYGGSQPTYYVPAALVPSLENALSAMTELDSANDGTGRRDESMIKMKIIPVRAGDEIEMNHSKTRGGDRLFLRAFDVDHAGHPALGYVVGRRLPGKLLPQYRGMASREIVELVKKGITVKAKEEERVEITYTGDTSARGLIARQPNYSAAHEGRFSLISAVGDPEREERSARHLKQAFQAPLILCELTYLDSVGKCGPTLAAERGHMHLQDVVRVLRSHHWCGEGHQRSIVGNDGNGGDQARKSISDESKRLVFFHLSLKYSAKVALDSIAAASPPWLIDRCDVVIPSLTKDQQTHPAAESWVKKNGVVSLREYLSRIKTTK